MASPILSTDTASEYVRAHFAKSGEVAHILAAVAQVFDGQAVIEVLFRRDDNEQADSMQVWIECGRLYGEW